MSASLGQAQIRVVLTQLQPIFRPGGKHAIRFSHTARSQVINHDSDIRFITARAPERIVTASPGCVEARNQTLPGGFFIARCAVDLSGKKESGQSAGFKSRKQVTRIKIVIFNRITRPGDAGAFKSIDTADHLPLNLKRQTGRKTIGIDLVDS